MTNSIFKKYTQTLVNKEQISDALIVGIIALTLRIINLEFYPRWYCDEGTNIQMGSNMLQGHFGYLTWGPNFFPPLYNFLVGLLVNPFGNNFFVARLPSVMMGALSCILLYFIGRRLYNRFVGLSSALLLSIAGMYINRMALSYTAIEFFFLLSVVFYLKLFDTGDKKWSYFAGLSAGLAFLSSYLGIVVFLFLFLQSLLNKKLNKIKFGMLTFFALGLTYPLLGVLFSWKWFTYDVFYQASRPFNPQQIVYILSLAAPYFRWDWLPPYHWTFLGFIACFYVMAKRDGGNHVWNNMFFLTMLFSVLAVFIFSTSIWWSSLILIYPIYCLAISLLVHDIYTGRSSLVAALLVSIVLLPPLVLNIALQFPCLNNYFSVFYYLVLALVLLAFLVKSNILRLNFKRKFTRFNHRNMSAKSLFVVVIIILVGLAFFADIPFLGTNAASDQVYVVNYINSHTDNSTMVAANPAIASQFHCVGLDYAQVAFYTLKKPLLLYEDVETMLSRFKMNISLENMKYIVFDSHWAGASSDAKGSWLGKELTTDIQSSWWNVLNVGDYSVYLNPKWISADKLSFIAGWKDTSFRDGWTLAYENGAIEQKFTSNGTLGLFMATSSPSPTSDSYVFWKKSIGNVSLQEYPSLAIHYKVSEPDCRVVVKLLSPEGKEVGGWLIGSSPATDYKLAVYNPTADTVSTIIVGMDSFGKANTLYTLYIDSIGLFKIVEK